MGERWLINVAVVFAVAFAMLVAVAVLRL